LPKNINLSNSVFNCLLYTFDISKESICKFPICES